jgi:hypothetical protein
METERCDAVIIADTHRDTDAAAITDLVGGQLANLELTAEAAGCICLLAWERERARAGHWR